MATTTPEQPSPPASKPNKLEFTLREMTADELEEVCWVASRAFLDDRMSNFMWNFEKSPTTRSTPEGMNIHYMFSFVVKSCFYFGGRIVLATIPSSSPSLPPRRSVTPPPGSSAFQGGKEKDIIAGVACWLPPGKRVNIWNLPVTVNCGIFKVLRKAGFGGFKRTVLEYMGRVEKTHEAAFKDHATVHSAHGSGTNAKESGDGNGNGNVTKRMKPKDAWYLSLVMTVKEFEGQGCLSLLMREGYAHAAKSAGPGASIPPFILESSSPKSRDRYKHLGYEVEDLPPTIAGVGKVDSDGRRVSKEARRRGTEAPGVEYWCMVNWDPKK